MTPPLAADIAAMAQRRAHLSDADGLDIAAEVIEERRQRLHLLLTENERIVASRVFEDGLTLYTAEANRRGFGTPRPLRAHRPS